MSNITNIELLLMGADTLAIHNSTKHNVFITLTRAQDTVALEFFQLSPSANLSYVIIARRVYE